MGRDFTLRTLLVVGAAMSVWLCESHGAVSKRRYVNHAATGQNNGLTWGNAFTSLQAALAEANLSTSQIEEIWVAQGTYRPGPPNGNRVTSTFTLSRTFSVYGGFRGVETIRTRRDPDLWPTILSGDLNANDVGDILDPSRGDNCMHVVTVTAGNPLLDGFTVTGGIDTDPVDGDPSDGFDGGGGVRVEGPTFRMNDCVVSYNRAGSSGGGLFLDGVESVVITRCQFIGNRAHHGGAIGSKGLVRLVIANSELFENFARTLGGAIDLYSPPSEQGGLVLLNTVIAHNRCGDDGDNGWGCGMLLRELRTRIHNTVIANNSGDDGVRGAGLAIYPAQTTEVDLVNSIVWGNTVDGGDGERQIAIVNNQGGQIRSIASNVERYQEGGVNNVNSSVQFVGALNLGTLASHAPLFAAPSMPSPDYSLLSGSPSIDAGDSTIVINDEADLDGDYHESVPESDPERLPFDLRDRPRYRNAVPSPAGLSSPGDCGPIDMGAFESQVEPPTPLRLVDTEIPTEPLASRFLRLLIHPLEVPVAVPGALMVRLEHLHHPHVFSGSAGSPGPPSFEETEGDVRWIGSLTSIGGRTYAKLQCEPFVHDLNTPGSLPNGVLAVHVYGQEIVPDSSYQIYRVDADCNSSYHEFGPRSLPERGRTFRWADVATPRFFGEAMQPDMADISALVGAFGSGSMAPIYKLRNSAGAGAPDPTRPVDFADISIALNAYMGWPFPYNEIATCP